MNAKQREQYWIKVERLRSQLDAKYTAMFADAIDKDLKRFIVMLKKNGPEATRSMMGTYVWNEEMFTIMQKLYKEAAILFGNASYRAVGLMSKKAGNPFGLNLDWINEMLSFLTKFGLQLVANMTNTTKMKIDAIISVGIAEGLSSEEIANMIMEDEELGYAKMRATRIARTEVMRASNYAAYVGASKHEFLVDKIWIATRDSRTRRIPKQSYDHWDMDGQIKAFDEQFTSVDKLGRPVVADIPGDPKSPKGFTINCFLPNEKTNINLNNIKRAFRNTYIGNVITIKSANGNSFTCTPNHPIMTDKGWVAAGLIKKGDNLIKSSFINDSIIPKFNIDGNPSTFEQIYNSLSCVNKPIRVRKTIVNFYGDIPDSDVDVINVKRELWDTIKSLRSKMINKVLFKYANFRFSLKFGYSRFLQSFNSLLLSSASHSLICTFNKFFSIFDRGTAHSQKHGFTSASLSYTGFFKPNYNRTSTKSKIFRNSLDAHTGIIHTDNSFDRERMVVVVTEIDTFHYKGFVYTFETDNQMYDINSFVARNCRCTVGFIPKRDANGRLILKR